MLRQHLVSFCTRLSRESSELLPSQPFSFHPTNQAEPLE
jgi:hypothetical protein